MKEAEEGPLTTAPAAPSKVAAEGASRRSPPPMGLEDWFRAHRRDLRRLAIFLGSPWEEVDDIVNDAMVDVTRAWNTIQAPWPYVFTVMKTHIIRERKRRQNLNRYLASHAGRPEEAEDLGTYWDDADWVIQALRRLPPAQREALALAVDQFSNQEISDLLGKSAEAVRQNLHYARLHLREEIPSDPRRSATHLPSVRHRVSGDE